MFAANVARQLGYGGVTVVSRACGLSRVTTTKALQELDGLSLSPGRVRRSRAGRPSLVTRDPELPQTLEELMVRRRAEYSERSFAHVYDTGGCGARIYAGTATS